MIFQYLSYCYVKQKCVCSTLITLIILKINLVLCSFQHINSVGMLNTCARLCGRLQSLPSESQQFSRCNLLELSSSNSSPEFSLLFRLITPSLPLSLSVDSTTFTSPVTALSLTESQFPGLLPLIVP